jgi:hypothetical protein
MLDTDYFIHSTGAHGEGQVGVRTLCRAWLYIENAGVSANVGDLSKFKQKMSQG